MVSRSHYLVVICITHVHLGTSMVSKHITVLISFIIPVCLGIFSGCQDHITVEIVCTTHVYLGSSRVSVHTTLVTVSITHVYLGTCKALTTVL